MDGLMQNHSSKTIIIIINDRRPGVASTATEKRGNHRQSLQNNFKNSIFSQKQGTKKSPQTLHPPSGAPHCYNQPANIYYRHLPRNDPQGELLGQLLQDTEADGTILILPGFCRNKNCAAFGEAAFEEQSSDRIPLLGGDSDKNSL